MLGKSNKVLNKLGRMSKAEEWLSTLSNTREYAEAIKNCIVTYNTWKVEECVPVQVKYETTKVSVFKNDVCVCAKAATAHADAGDKVCVLDFASYRNPGGGFLKGAVAQEESLCGMSGLFPILNNQKDIYERRLLLDNFDTVYNDDMFYCQDVPFMVNSSNMFNVDVIVAAAPNKSNSKVRKIFSSDEVTAILRQRMELVYLIPYLFGANTLLLGAWGCGVFGNDVEAVAKHWNFLSKDRYNGLYKTVIHPVLDIEQYKIFKKICH